MRGTTSRTTRPARALITGARTASPASATTTSGCCFALALWNGKDPILKERLFGLTNSEGNHGEDVKEYYFYLDSTPTHSYMKYLYKYPQHAYPYGDLIETNRRRGRDGWEYELLDTGVFNDDRYFDVFVEYAKAAPDRHPDPNQRRESRTRGGFDPRAANAVVPQHLDLVAGPAETLLATDAWAKHRHDRNVACRARWFPAALRRKSAPACSPKTTPTTSGSSARPTRHPMSRTGSTTMSWRVGRTPSTRTRPGPRPLRTISSMSAPGKPPSSG